MFQEEKKRLFEIFKLNSIWAFNELWKSEKLQKKQNLIRVEEEKKKNKFSFFRFDFITDEI